MIYVYVPRYISNQGKKFYGLWPGMKVATEKLQVIQGVFSQFEKDLESHGMT
jgi:hypothetical protein